MALGPEDLLLADALIRLGFISRDRIDPTAGGPLGDRLVAEGALTAAQLDQARAELRSIVIDRRFLEPDEGATPDEVRAVAEHPENRVGKLVLLTRVGRGGNGEVWKAWDGGIGRHVAVKLLAQGAEEGDRRRLVREAQVAARLAHPNIVPVFEVGDSARGPYISMQFIEGRTLAAAELTIPQRVAALRDAALAIDFAHSQGVVHRDLKPHNIMVEPGDPPRVWVTDFGMAKQRAVSTSLSASGVVVGTPAYMPPEQARGRSKEIDATSDVYALGATLYHLLTGKPPYHGEDPLEVLDQVVSNDPVSPSKLAVGTPRDLETITLKCLEKIKSHRYSSARELAEDLQRFLDGKSIRARPVGPIRRLGRILARRAPWVAALVMSAAFAAALFVYIRSSGFQIIEIPPRETPMEQLFVPAPELPPFAELASLRMDGLASFRAGDRVALAAAVRLAESLHANSATDEGVELVEDLTRMSKWRQVWAVAFEKADDSAVVDLEAITLPADCAQARDRGLDMLREAARLRKDEELRGAVREALGRKDVREAEALLMALEDRHAGGVEGLRNEIAALRKSLEREADLARAGEQLRIGGERLKAAWRPREDPARRKRWLEEGLAAVDEAIRGLESRGVSSADAWLVRGQILHSLQRWSEAREAFGRIDAAHTLRSKALYWRGACAYLQAVREPARKEHLESAEADLRQVRDLPYRHLHFMLAAVYALTDRPKEAIDEATAAINQSEGLTDEEMAAGFYVDRTEPNVAFQCDSLLLRAKLKRASRDFEGCIRDCSSVLQRNAEHWEAMLERAHSLFEAGRYREGLPDAERVRDGKADDKLKARAKALIQAYAKDQ